MMFLRKNKAIVFAVVLLACVNVFAVSSKVVRHSSFEDFTAKEAKSENVIINSQGEIALSPAIETLVENIDDVWLINDIAINKDGVVYLGTSPNGEIYKYDGKLVKIYPAENAEVIKSEKEVVDANAVADANDPNDPNAVVEEKAIINKHVFALEFDAKGNLLAGVSGEKAELVYFEGDKFETVFEPNDANYIFAIVCDKDGDIYLGTGPAGKIYELSGTGKKNKDRVVYDAKDKNIISLALGADGKLYAGSDERGLVYEIDIATASAKVLYDSGETDVTAISVDDEGNVYAATTSEDVARNQASNAAKSNGGPMPGKSANGGKNGKSVAVDDGGLKLKIANIKPEEKGEDSERMLQAQRPAAGGPASHVYKIDKSGMIEDVYSKIAMIFDIELIDGKLYIATGNEAELFAYLLDDEKDSLLFQDETAIQILSVKSYDGDVFIATGNPAKLLKVKSDYSRTGFYESPLVDAGQPAKWGKLHIEADIPSGGKINMQARTGNVAEANDTTFSDWSPVVALTEPVSLNVERGRFCQYKLIFETEKLNVTPVLNEVVLAYVVENLAPKILAVKVEQIKDKQGYFAVQYKGVDQNEDDLIYKIELKKTGYQKWIEIEKDYEKTEFQFDGRTVEDGRYEVKVTASDVKSNDAMTKLEGARISDVFVVDNTPAEIDIKYVKREDDKLEIKVDVKDKLSMIDSLHYTVNSSDDWKAALPEDIVFDTTSEDFTVVLKDIKPGFYVISFKAGDSAGNVSYKSVEVAAE